MNTINSDILRIHIQFFAHYILQKYTYLDPAIVFFAN